MRRADYLLKPCPRCSEGILVLPRPCHHCKSASQRRRRRGRHFNCLWCRDTGELRGPLACEVCRGSGRQIVVAPSRASGTVLQSRLAQPMVTEREGWQKGGEGIFSRNAWDPD